MNEELEFLEYIHNIINLEKDSLARIVKIREKDDILNKMLKEQILVYKKFEVSVRRMIKTRTSKDTDLSLLAKMASHMGVKLIVSTDSSIEAICNMLNQRYKICIDEVKNKVSEYNIKSKNIIKLANRFVEFQNKNIESLNKAYIIIDK